MVTVPMLLAGCLQFGFGTGPGSGSRGSFSYDSQVSFLTANNFCGPTESICFYQIQKRLWIADEHHRWHLDHGITDGPLFGMLEPTANQPDVIEARGGPNFGYDGDTNPVFLQGDGFAGSVAVSKQAGSAVNGDTYNLIPETVNESAWRQRYGNPTGTYSTPTANEHNFTSSTASVSHFLASGAIVAESPNTGTAGGIDQAQAYQYALSWIADNGSLPADAVLTWAGRINNPLSKSILPCPSGSGLTAPCDIPASAIPADNGTRLWEFIWRHRSSILWGDKIEIAVDDAGMWTVNQQACGGRPGVPHFCIVPPWIPSPHVTLYVRIWRSVGSVRAHHALIALPDSMAPLAPTATKTITGLCAPDAGTTNTVAVPCQQYAVPGGKVHYYLSLIDGTQLGSN